MANSTPFYQLARQSQTPDLFLAIKGADVVYSPPFTVLVLLYKFTFV